MRQSTAQVETSSSNLNPEALIYRKKNGNSPQVETNPHSSVMYHRAAQRALYSPHTKAKGRPDQFVPSTEKCPTTGN
jgi:hypothetical protein